MLLELVSVIYFVSVFFGWSFGVTMVAVCPIHRLYVIVHTVALLVLVMEWARVGKIVPLLIIGP